MKEFIKKYWLLVVLGLMCLWTGWMVVSYVFSDQAMWAAYWAVLFAYNALTFCKEVFWVLY